MSADLEDIITTDEAAEISGRSAEAVRKALQRGSLRGKHVGRLWVTTTAELREWMAWGPVDRRNAKSGRYESPMG